MPVTIRPYKPTDRKQLIQIMNRFQDHLVALDDMKRKRRAPGYGEAYVKKTLREVRENQGVLYVAEDGKKLVGVAAGIIVKPAPTDRFEEPPRTKVGRVTELYLDPLYRGQKIGMQLMEMIEVYFRKKKCTTALLFVFAPNQSARDFYARRGYRDRHIDMLKEL